MQNSDLVGQILGKQAAEQKSNSVDYWRRLDRVLKGLNALKVRDVRVLFNGLLLKPVVCPASYASLFVLVLHVDY